MTWFSMTLWSVFMSSLLICTSLAYNSYADFETSNSVQYPHNKGEWKELDQDKNNYLFETGSPGELSGRFLDLNTWPERDSITMSRQLFGDKSPETSEALRSHGTEVNEEDLPKKKRESHSLSIVNPLDVLRQRLMLEMARRRMKENQDQIRENAVILKNLGKRASSFGIHGSRGNQDESRTNQDYIRRIHMSNSEDFEV